MALWPIKSVNIVALAAFIVLASPVEKARGQSIVTDGDIVSDGVSLRDLKSALCESASPAPQLCALQTGERFVFTTQASSPFGGDLVQWANNLLGPATFTDGLLAADAICQYEADRAVPKLPGTYTAWLSTSIMDAKDRIGDHKWITPQPPHDEVVAGSIADLLNCSNPDCLNNAIDETQFYTGPASTVWTGTNDAGQLWPGSHCNNWTSSDPLDSGISGDAYSQNTNWTADTNRPCDTSAALYCFGR